MSGEAVSRAPLLSVGHLTVSYARGKPPAVRDISFSVEAGECVGLVGTSGCGKSTVARALVGLEKPTSGEIRWRGKRLADFSGEERRAYCRHVQLIFQDTLGALNPRMRVGDCLDEVLRVHRAAELPDRAARRACVAALLERVELAPELASRYPHEISGGQRQRVGIARALAVEPDLIVADEPVSALDVAVQAQVLEMLKKLLRATGISMVFISHDLAVVRSLCPRILVMRRGEIVESGMTDEVYAHPRHPFTKALLDAVPKD